MKNKNQWPVLGFVIAVVLLVSWWVRMKSSSPPAPPMVQMEQVVRTPVVEVPLVDPHAPKVAIVLDDWGYNLNNLPILNQIQVPMTLAVLPHLRFSSRIAKSLGKKNYEFILHMPMEAHNGKIRPEEKTLYTSMEEEEIRSLLKGAIESVPYIRGISNHMGSKVTEDSRVLRIVMEELQKRELYFLDSLVTPYSVAEEMSQQIGIPFAKRNIFLDNKLEAEYIKAQLLKTAEQAKQNGAAIGIGHDRSMTLRVLQEMIPQLQKEGIQFVYASQLTEKK